MRTFVSVGTGLIYAAIVAAWAVYLVPLWLRRNDEAQATRAGDPMSETSRVLRGRRRRSTDDSGNDSEDDESAAATLDDDTDSEGSYARPHGTTVVRSAAATAARSRTGDRHGDSGRSGDSGDSEGPRVRGATREADGPAVYADDIALHELEAIRPGHSAAARRGRVLLSLVLATTLVAVLAVVGVLPGWSLAVPGTLLVGFAALSAALGRRERRSRWVYDRRTPREGSAYRSRERNVGPAGNASHRFHAEGEHATGPGAGEVAQQGSDGAEPITDPLRSRGDGATESAGASTGERARTRRPGSGSYVGGEVWDPVSVPLPTYVNKAKAPRTVRTIDLSEPGTYSAGRHGEGTGDAEPQPTEPSAYRETHTGSGAAPTDRADEQQGPDTPAYAETRDDLFDQEQVRPAVGD